MGTGRRHTHAAALAWGLAFTLPLPAVAAAQSTRANDPYYYDLRLVLFPVAFSAGLHQSTFGSGARAELDFARGVSMEAAAIAPWLPVAGRDEGGGYSLRVGLLLNVIDHVGNEKLAGTVYPKDAASPNGRGNVGTDTDLAVPISTRMGGPALRPPEHAGDEDTVAPLRTVHTLRVGYDLTRAIERAQPTSISGRTRYARNTVHALYLGYGFGSQWNLSPAVAGQREIGYRHFYLDALLTLDPLVDAELLSPPAREAGDSRPKLVPVGLRLGMQGAIDALVRSAPGVGFGYSLELGALPGRSGFAGYLLIGLGLALDVPVGR